MRTNVTRWLALTLPLALILAACGDDPEPVEEPAAAVEEPADTEEDTQPEEDVEATEEPGDPVEAELEELYEAAQEEDGPIVIYGPASDTRQPMWDAFSERFPGLEVEGVVVTGAELRERIDAEFISGQHVASVVSTGGTAMVDFAEAELFEVYEPASLRDLPEEYWSPDGRIHAFTGFAFVNIYNTDMVSEDEAPRSWEDLFDWSGEITTGDPTRPAGAMPFLLLRMLNDPNYGEAFLEEFSQVEMNFMPATFEIGSQVARGEWPIGAAVPLQFVTTLVGEDAPIEIIFPIEGGNHLSEHWMGVVENAPNPNGARLLKAWMFTDEAQTLMAEINEYPLQPGMPGPAGLPPASEIEMLRPMTYDEIRTASDNYSRVHAFWE